MKKNRYLIMLLTIFLYLSFSVPSTSAAHKQRHHRHQGHREVQKLRVPSTNKKIRKLPPKHRRQGEHWKLRRAWVQHTYKKIRRHSLRYRQQGHWELKKVWVPPTPNYRRVRIPGHHTRLGKRFIGHWIRIVDQPGYWAKTWVWVANR